ncbi:unnamed protein product [Trifolium pratense]|uniref:Uncharacterized protein n=1 Tax=Trifolium pratense TaxID=57577 RepID=A0ACB0LV24_TRIPR|nr:unnamed protein product [Trifolium pratense]
MVAVEEGACRKESLLMKADFLLGQEEGEQKGGVYSDGPRSVYQKLNKGPSNKESLLLRNHTIETNKENLKRINPTPAKVRRQNHIIRNLNLRAPNSFSSLSGTRSSSSGKEVSSRRVVQQEKGVCRSSPSRYHAGKKSVNSLSSAGAVLCCSSINSSDIRNCNNRFVEIYDHDAASKVWQGAVVLGVEGEEEDERYVERILINEKKEEQARVLREQHQHSFP